MNDNDTLRAVSGRLNGARHNLDDINMGTSAGEIMGRARKRRAGRLLATAGTGGAAQEHAASPAPATPTPEAPSAPSSPSSPAPSTPGADGREARSWR